MSVRVNMLRPHEIQRQSAVSRGFLVHGAMVLAIGAAVLAAGFGAVQYQQTRSTHRRLKAQWAAMEADYRVVKNMTDEHAANMKYVTELDAWQRSRLDWETPLAALQAAVPENLQFTRLNIQGDVAVSKAEPATDKQPGTPARTYSLGLEGRAVGVLSDQDVIAFVDRVRESPAIHPWVDWVRLQGMQRDTAVRDEGAEVRLFRVNAASQERLMK